MQPRFLRGFWKLTWVETKIVAREPMGFVGTLVMPVLVFIILGRALGARRGRPQLGSRLADELDDGAGHDQLAQGKARDA